jgi:hypothetical protein
MQGRTVYSLINNNNYNNRQIYRSAISKVLYVNVIEQ